MQICSAYYIKSTIKNLHNHKQMHFLYSSLSAGYIGATVLSFGEWDLDHTVFSAEPHDVITKCTVTAVLSNN